MTAIGFGMFLLAIIVAIASVNSKSKFASQIVGLLAAFGVGLISMGLILKLWEVMP